LVTVALTIILGAAHAPEADLDEARGVLSIQGQSGCSLNRRRERHVSLEIFVVFFSDQEPATVPRTIIETAFGPFVVRVEPGLMQLSFPDDGEADVFVDDAAEVGGMMISGPPPNPEFWESLFDILRQTRSALFWPPGQLVVANPGAIEHLPPDMVESMGEPIVVSAPSEILQAIESDD
jgi:hypothetical protein